MGLTIGELIKDYREKNKLSQRQLAARCGISNGYLSMLESGVNVHTGETITPSLKKLKQIADGMRVPVHDLISKADDIDIDLLNTGSDTKKAPAEADAKKEEKEIAEKWDRLSELVQQIPEDKREEFAQLLEVGLKMQGLL